MNKEERIQYVLDSIKDNVAVNIALSLVEECDELQQENKKYKEVIDKSIEYIWRTEINSIGTPLAYITIGKELLDILKEVSE